MRLLICGSAASEGIPALFCECEVCRKARAGEGRDIRSRCAYQLGDAVRVDFGPDSFHHMVRYRLDYLALTDLFLSHAHRDHLHSQSLGYRAEGFSRTRRPEPLRLHADPEVLKAIGNSLAEYRTDFDGCRIDPRPLRDGEEIPLAFPGLRAKAYPARHGGSAHLFSFRAADAEKGTFIGNDTGPLAEASWEMLAGERFALLLLDATYGPGTAPENDSHMGLGNLIALLDRMRENGMADENTLAVANHFSHNGGMTHEELCRAFRPHGIEAGYDGMELELP